MPRTWMTDYVETGKRPGKKNKSLPKKETTMAQRNNSGAIFANDRKTQDNHPDGRGSCMIDGKEYWISSWNKTANGKVFRSLSFELKVAAAQRNNSGAIFANDRKTQDNHPDGRGSCMIDGKEYWISSWNKTANGKVFRSLSFEPKVAATPQGAPAQAAASDDLPF